MLSRFVWKLLLSVDQREGPLDTQLTAEDVMVGYEHRSAAEEAVEIPAEPLRRKVSFAADRHNRLAKTFKSNLLSSIDFRFVTPLARRRTPTWMSMDIFFLPALRLTKAKGYKYFTRMA